MKLKIFFIAILLLAMCSNLFSQKLYFSATSYRSGLSLTLDSVRIINKDISFDTIVKNNFVLKSIFTSVDEQTSNQNINPISIKFISQYQIIISLNANRLSDGSSQLKIFNYIGDELFSKTVDNNSINNNITFTFPSDGVFFISYFNNINFSIKKLLINGISNHVSSIESNNNISCLVIKQTYLYDFIAYKSGYKPDTLKSVDVSPIDTLKFILLDDSKYNFRNGKISISNLHVVFKKDISEANHEGGYEHHYTDSLYKTYSPDRVSCNDTAINDEGPWVGPYTISCGNIINEDNIVRFCCKYNKYSYQDENHVTRSDIDNNITIIIDDTNNLLKSVEWKVHTYIAYTDHPIGMGGVGHTTINKTIILHDMPFTILDDGTYRTYISQNALSYITSIYDYSKDGFSPTSSTYRDTDYYYSSTIDDVGASILIELYP